MDLMVLPGGKIRCVYGEAIDLTTLGSVHIQRASHVEPNADGNWTADLAPVAGPKLGPFSRRSQALDAEADWLVRQWLV